MKRLLLLSLFSAAALWGQTEVLDADSTFWLSSLPELQNYRTYYVQELQTLQEQKLNLIQKGIDDGERLLASNPDPKIVDEILIRLADLYYYQDKDLFLAELDRFDEQLTRYQEGQIQQLPPEPQLNYSRSLQIYQRIIDEFPQSSLVDDAVYNKGFLYEEMFQNDKANQIYRHLIDAYPNSVYVPEAYMRLGEYFFNPPRTQLETAIEYYKNVLRFRDNPRYEEALYKLGWSYYRLSEYPQAISYFTQLIENAEAMKKFNPEGVAMRADLMAEAIEYVGISFLDFGGPPKVREYLMGVGNPSWGWSVLNKLGDVYMQEKEEYRNAIVSYGYLIDYDPLSPKAPVIQKKIVDCYHLSENEQAMFDERHKLFLNYNTNSVWWSRMQDEDAKLKAYELAEQALRENINYMIKRSEETKTEAIYRQVVDMGRTYLEAFPEDLYAYMVRWNIALILDTKLHDYKAALQEYLTISMVYTSDDYETFAREKGLASLKDAAENAIVVADSLVRHDDRVNPDPVILSESDEAVPLSTSESWLAMAYDNYIKRFPFDTNTPAILASAGALHYTHNQYTEALKYFKTLTKYFPKSKHIQRVQIHILDSYFGKKDYQSAEILAKRIIDSDSAPDIKEKAQKRLGEAIFFKAQTIAEEGDALTAAEEYYRMALETPTLEFADRALFNAAREYEKQKEFESAIRAYELLRASYGGSTLITDVLNNVAFDYGEIGNYQKAGERYEQLAMRLNGQEGSRDAHYNAIVFYRKAENWFKAVDVSESFIQDYPDTDDAPEIFFLISQYNHNLGDEDAAANIYRRFPEMYPDSPLVVEAYFRLGEYYQNHAGDKARAREAFYTAFKTHEGLVSRNLEGNAFFAAEGLFLSNQLLHEEYQKISFLLPEEEMTRAMTRKHALREQLIDQYTQVVAFNTSRLPESVYRIGEVHEEFARAWAAQEVPVLSENELVMKEREIDNRTTQIYGQALNAYRQALSGLERVLAETNQQRQAVETEEAGLDTLVLMTSVWLDRSKSKVSEMLYRMAEVNQKSVERFLAAPIPEDLNDLARLEYRSQVLIKAVKPVLDVVTEAHRRNLMVADSLDLENEWTQASRQKIIEAMNVMSRGFQDLALDGLARYTRQSRRFTDMTLIGGSMAPEDLLNSMVNLIEISKTYSQYALAFSLDGIKKMASFGIPETDIKTEEEADIAFVLGLSDTLDARIRSSYRNQQSANMKFNETGDLLYEETLAAFEDNVYFLEENQKFLLETAWDVTKQLPVSAASASWIPIRLVRFDHEAYAGTTGIPVRTLTLTPDSTWQVAADIPRGNQNQSQVWRPLTDPAADTLRVASAENTEGLTPRPSMDIRFFKKEFVVSGLPVSCQLSANLDQMLHLFMNNRDLTVSPEIDSKEVLWSLNNGVNRLAGQYKEITRYPLTESITIHYIPEAVFPSSGE